MASLVASIEYCIFLFRKITLCLMFELEFREEEKQSFAFIVFLLVFPNEHLYD